MQETFVELFGKERLSTELKASSQMKLEEVKQTNATAREEVRQRKEARQWIPSASMTGTGSVHETVFHTIESESAMMITQLAKAEKKKSQTKKAEVC